MTSYGRLVVEYNYLNSILIAKNHSLDFVEGDREIDSRCETAGQG